MLSKHLWVQKHISQSISDIFKIFMLQLSWKYLMCISQIKPVSQLGLSSQFDNKFLKCHNGLQDKISISVASCHDAPQKLQTILLWSLQVRSFWLLLPTCYSHFQVGRKSSLKTIACQRLVHQAEKDFLQLGLCPHNLCELQRGNKKLPRPTTHPLSQFIVISDDNRSMNNHSLTI